MRRAGRLRGQRWAQQRRLYRGRRGGRRSQRQREAPAAAALRWTAQFARTRRLLLLLPLLRRGGLRRQRSLRRAHTTEAAGALHELQPSGQPDCRRSATCPRRSVSSCVKAMLTLVMSKSFMYNYENILTPDRFPPMNHEASSMFTRRALHCSALHCGENQTNTFALVGAGGQWRCSSGRHAGKRGGDGRRESGDRVV